ncbi:MAG: glycosyltransferase [Ramlibacter sp.]|nr:glycosyltransferase [Ramlibacter sp.]
MSAVNAIGLALLLLTALVAVPVGVLFVQLTAATLRREPQASVPAPGSHVASVDFAVLMPAHNEADGITAAIRAVQVQLGSQDRLLVVADNCTDATASVSRAAGAEVTERTDPERRGKGYALDHGVRWLERTAPALVIIVDADCIVAEGALRNLVQQCVATARPVQALYLMHAPPGSGLGLRVAAFAWVVKNKLRPLGSAALGWPCQLMGTGMAFPWRLIATARLACGDLVEDMALGAAMAQVGAAPMFCPQALVSSAFPSDTAGARAQRTRWEHGHMSMLAGTGPRLLGQALMRRDAALAALALDLMVPPLAALALVLVALLAFDFFWWSFSTDPFPFALAALAAVLFGMAVLAAWWHSGRHLVRPRELVGLPWYVAAKVPMYIRLFTRRQIEWVRTKRDDPRI